MRLVLDTNVVVSAFFWNGAPRRLLQASRAGHIELFTSTALLAEMTDVLSRKKFEKKIAASLFTVDQLVDRYAALALLVKPEFLKGVAPDPDDDVVIATALAAQASFLVTGDKPLLSLVGYQSVSIVEVETALQALTKKGNTL